MRVLLAPDKYKGTLSARAVAEAMAAGLRDLLPGIELDLQPVADGGEGTAEILCAVWEGEWRSARAHDAIGHPIEARFAWRKETGQAALDMSETAGMARLKCLEPARADTFGVGEMMKAAAEQGAKEIVVGLGGSATNDGGWGMARALGYEFLGRDGAVLEEVCALAELERIVPPAAPFPVRVVAAADVANPLLGARGATAVFGPQKGVRDLARFEAALTRLAEVAARQWGRDESARAGAGAAGGLGFGLLVFAGAKIEPGFEVVSRALSLPERVAAADLVLTGEGQLDAQTLEGKAPAGVARLARAAGKRCLAVVGRSRLSGAESQLFDRVIAVLKAGASATGIDPADAVRRTVREGLREEIC